MTDEKETTKVVEPANTTPEEEKTFVTIGKEEFEITPLDAKKTAFIANMFGKLLLTGKMKLRELEDTAGGDLPFAILAAVDEEMLVNLAATLIGSDATFAKEEFELGWVMEALVIQTQVSNLDAVIRNFTALVTQIA